jgi:ribulose-phosphate 3-epimerase
VLDLKIAPSMLCADFGRLREVAQEVTAAGADMLHFDVMDGRFVPNLTHGPLVLRALRDASHLPFDTHLMIVEPERFVDEFAEAGADIILVQVEAVTHLNRLLRHIRDLGATPGIVLNPGTSESAAEYALDEAGQVLVMTVDPGFAGQEFITSCLKKIERLRNMIDARGLQCEIEVDGGIGLDNARQVVEAGADILVSGTSVMAADVPIAEAIARLRKAAGGE